MNNSKHFPRKRFGQHFLHEQHVVDRIIRSLHPRPGEHIVEIGPGLGALTGDLLAVTDTLQAIELDRDLVVQLKERFDEPERLIIHQADALKFDFCSLSPSPQKVRLIGNLPYNISTPLIFHVLEQSHCIQDMYFMLQKEVVDRMAAPPGGKDYGRLSVMVQWRCEVEKLFEVGPGAFTPPPKVQSAVVRLAPYAISPLDVNDPKIFSRLVQQAFSQRRKSLRNTLKGMLSAQDLEAVGIDPRARAETLSVEEFARLSNMVK
ncbi:MAG TPA: 16S rRNA (adenine(1518)-N(6)/adenine(1519)-N(6))-dimethyltransferase RsmA [Acidiferrobacteraceae bacterium]|nr:16S rRNA (adenine(1518)-N(6)/adenine(1519)-N(6))-dimethyltransferase RsmA [Acidiferrobacteraceae bacterium]